LFGRVNEQFFIQAYQRRYSWGKKQYDDLFEDIYYLENLETHLLGNLVCLSPKLKNDVYQLEVVDGQQRLTALTILFKSLIDRYNELSKEDLVNEINKILQCEDADENKRNKLLLIFPTPKLLQINY